MGERTAGVLLPLFALRGARDWGVGELGDLPAFGRWLRRAGHQTLYLLPTLERASGERSPYAALSAFALDPIYLALRLSEDFVTIGGESQLVAADRAMVEAARGAAGIDPEQMRPIKRRALTLAFAHFEAREAASGSSRARAFDAFCEREAAWLEDYTLFRALRDSREGEPWWTWPEALRLRMPAAMDAAAGRVGHSRRYHAWVQWLAQEQWEGARRDMAGVQLVGDLPFMVGRDSADVWARQHEFDVVASVGAPPDQFDADGQDWGLPPCRWDVMGEDEWRWHRRRIGRLATLVDGCRVDHVVGYFRTWIRPGDASAAGFVPDDVPRQRSQGEALLRATVHAADHMAIVAEDLGAVPEFVHESLRAMAIPGYRILRWEWEGTAPRDPRTYPACSVATSGTHDTSSLAQWWSDELDDAGRAAMAGLAVYGARREAPRRLDDEALEWLLGGLYAAGSDRVNVPFPDTYGGRERINIPATVGLHNWTYRMPWSVEELDGAAVAPLAARLRRLAEAHGRLGR